MRIKRRVRTTVVARQVLTIHSVRRCTAVASCLKCPSSVVLIALDEAIKLCGVSSRAIHRWIEEGCIHFAETQDGLTLICPVSLLSRLTNTQTN